MAIGELGSGRLKAGPTHRDLPHRSAALNCYVGERVRSRRLAAGLSQPELARLAGLNKRQIQNLEIGRTGNLIVLVSVADVFDCTLDDLAPVGWESE